jgi:hypothetical protein
MEERSKRTKGQMSSLGVTPPPPSTTVPMYKGIVGEKKYFTVNVYI